MTQHLAEQMRSIARRLEEVTHETMPQDALKGTLNPRQLAELLGIDDMPVFTRAIRKVQAGDTDKLTRIELTELAVAFVNLLAAEPEDTQKAMIAIKRVSAKAEEPVMESQEDLNDREKVAIKNAIKRAAMANDYQEVLSALADAEDEMEDMSSIKDFTDLLFHYDKDVDNQEKAQAVNKYLQSWPNFQKIILQYSRGF